VSAPPLLGPGRSDEALAALADGQVIAVPGDGGYLLAVRHGVDGAAVRLRALGLDSGERGSVYVVVGRREQAVALASAWTDETAHLTDRMWPGPLTVTVPTRPSGGDGAPVVSLTMPASRLPRLLCRDGEPLTVGALRRPDGTPMVDPAEVGVRFTSSELALIMDGGICRGAGPTVVDCTTSPPVVRHVGALPESYVDAALMMGNRRRKWFARRSRPGSPAR
jgi:tRNA A37 threonylcarbamoyladenosine synthetase subunit TsaC/SUA5/YrdC